MELLESQRRLPLLRTLIVEDEPLARDLLRRYVSVHPELQTVGEAANGHEALALIEQTSPDLLLLDIELPEISGLEIARQTKESVAIIFVTAWDAHAVAAFEIGAFDYLLKPVLPDRFAAAVNRVKKLRQRLSGGYQFRERLEHLTQQGYLKRFFVQHLGAIVPVNVEDIIRLESDDDYTAIIANGKRFLIHLALREMVKRLDPDSFVRVHRCDVVNLSHVLSFVRDDRRFVLSMSDGAQVVSSRAGSQDLLMHLL